MKIDHITKLEKIFRMVDDNDLLDFCKEYAFGHRDPAESLIKKYISALTDRIDSDGRSRTKWLLREASYLRARVKEIVSHLAAKKSFFNRKEISGICAEDHMIPQLVESLLWDDFRSEECLESLKQYSGLLDGKQREGLVTSYVENLRMDAVEVNSSHYGRIRYSMELLRDSCPEGAAAVKSLASEFCELYHRRPAFMREMRRLMSSSYTT